MGRRPAIGTVEVDAETYQLLKFAARIGGCTTGDVVRRLVAEAGAASDPAEEIEHSETVQGTAVYADYAGYRTYGNLDRTTTRVDITSGPLAGRGFKTPTAAARAVVGHYAPGVSPNRNGWKFWRVDDGSGKVLESIREMP
jgi:hypothetical protein